MRIWAVIGAIGMVLLMGCATSLTNGSPAKTYDAGKGQASVSYQFDVHTQAFEGVYRAGRSAVRAIEGVEEGEEITEEMLRNLLDAAILWQLFPLGGSPEAMGRVGIYDGLLEGVDLGFRYNGNVIKGDLRLQVWESADEAHGVSFQVGYGRHKALVPTLLEWVDLGEWSRNDIDLQVAWGFERDDWAKIYAAPKYLYSSISTELRLGDYVRERLPEEYRQYEPSQYLEPSGIHYAGLNMGAMFGYKWIFLNLDLSMFRVLFRPNVLGSIRDYDGWVFSPTGGIVLVWP